MLTPALIAAGGLSTTALLLYGVLLCVIPLAIFWRPVIALYVLVPLMPLQTLRYQLQVLPLGDKFVDLLLIAAILGHLVHLDGEPFIPSTRLNGYLFWYCLFLFAMLWYGSFMLQLPWPVSPSDARLADWKNFVEMPILFLLVVALVRTRRQMLLLLALMMLTMLRANLGFYHTVSGRDFSHFDNNLRYAGVLGYAGQNGLAAFVVELLIFLLAIAPAMKSTWVRVLTWASVAFSAYCALFSFSRGAYVGLLGGLVVLGLLKDRRYLIFVAVLLFTWKTIVPDAVRERITMTYAGGQVESSANKRLQLWDDAFTIIPQHPVLGTGFVTYRYLGRSADYLDTHNYYVKVLVETGIVGLLLFGCLLWLIMREGFSVFFTARDSLHKRLGMGLVAMTVSVVLVNLFGDRWMYQQITGYMWAFLGLTVRARVLEETQVTADSPRSEVLPETDGVVA